MRKLFFCGTAGFDNPGAWSKMLGEAEARDMVSVSLELAGWKDKPLSRFRVERHDGSDGDVKVYLWGEDEPGFQGDDFGQHEGTKVEVDGKVVYNDLKPSSDEDPGDHEECEDCAKPARPG